MGHIERQALKQFQQIIGANLWEQLDLARISKKKRLENFLDNIVGWVLFFRRRGYEAEQVGLRLHQVHVSHCHYCRHKPKYNLAPRGFTGFR